MNVGFVEERVIEDSLTTLSFIFHITYAFVGQRAKPNKPEAGIHRGRTWSQTSSKCFHLIIIIYFIESKSNRTLSFKA